LVAGRREVEGLGGEAARGVFFDLLDAEFGGGEAGLALLVEFHAVLVVGEEFFEGEFVVFHRMDDGVEFVEGFFEGKFGRGRSGRFVGFNRFRHWEKVKRTGAEA
jgi:hypothetical protein